MMTLGSTIACGVVGAAGLMGLVLLVRLPEAEVARAGTTAQATRLATTFSVVRNHRRTPQPWSRSPHYHQY